MVIQVGIDQIPRRLWKFKSYEQGWINANLVNEGPPQEYVEALHKDGKYVYGFNDFVIAELTPHMAYNVKGAVQGMADRPPKHPRGYPGVSEQDTFSKSRSGYYRIAYGYGKKVDIFDLGSTKNEYVVLEGPKDESWTGSPIVMLIALPIPGGLKQNDTFWIDLNKGLRALYFPARYIYSKDFPGDAAYAKISFVEKASRRIIDAKPLQEENTFGKEFKPWFGDITPPLSLATRENSELANLNIESTVGAYSFDSTLIVNVPQFIESCFLVSMNPSTSAHDSIYLAKSTDIKAFPRKDGSVLESLRANADFVVDFGSTEIISRVDGSAVNTRDKELAQAIGRMERDWKRESDFDDLLVGKSLENKLPKGILLGGKFKFPGRALAIEWNSYTYAAFLSEIEQINLTQVSDSDLSPGAEMALTVLIMAVSLVPYVGPFLATGGTLVVERLKNVVTSETPELGVLGITAAAWNSAPNEAKDSVVARLLPTVKMIIKARGRK
ncbi:hypothetical protein MMC31_006558 [Peltigera leucophlebia]|nr:hypothetical protein [Peltigera leucophlebia]